VHPPVPASSISMGRGARLRPPASGAPSMVTIWPLPVSATKDMPLSAPIHFTVHCIFILQVSSRYFS